MSDAPVLELVEVRAGYGRIEVLHGVSLSLHPGEVLALLGPNGAGKTTTLGVAGGRLPVMGGHLHIAGRHVNGIDVEDVARAGVCTIPEGRGVFPNLTVEDNLVVYSYAGIPESEVRERAFERFPQLAGRRRQLAGTLSGGEQQMLALARGLTTDPAVLLIDELSMGLAPRIVEDLFEEVRGAADDGVAILVVEQFAAVVLPVADRAAVMVGGAIVYDGSPAEAEALVQDAYLGAS
ncbi:MAG: ABC transporter ATP-binding protein [Actinomycetota bacterium]|nr:ABC transporter ATP-binding protein [Actinomycetota bacterium]